MYLIRVSGVALGNFDSFVYVNQFFDANTEQTGGSTVNALRLLLTVTFNRNQQSLTHSYISYLSFIVYLIDPNSKNFLFVSLIKGMRYFNSKALSFPPSVGIIHSTYAIRTIMPVEYDGLRSGR